MRITATPDWATISEVGITCPHPDCHFEYVHPTAVIVNRGGEFTTITSDGTRVSSGNPDGRGVSITTHYACESGHAFYAVEHFHKGETSRTIGIIERSGPASSPGNQTIWRD